MYLQRLHGWCHMKLLPSRRVPCTPYNHTPCHFMQSHIRKVHACLAVICHLHFWQNDQDLLRPTAVTRGWNCQWQPPVSFLSRQTRVATKVLRQMFSTNTCLSRQNTSLSRQKYVCHDKLTFVATNMSFVATNMSFVVTKLCLSRQIFWN